jgi:signal recognition particle subunit SRP54
MFDNLTERLNRALKNIRGQGRLTQSNIAETLKEVHDALLEADVALSVVKAFVAQIETESLGKEVTHELNPGQAFIKIVHQSLVELLGKEQVSLSFNTQPPAVILMSGLQGSGKTTTTAKLAALLKNRENKKVMVVSTDIYRPAAIEQLKQLADNIDVRYFPSETTQKPVDIAKSALSAARKEQFDVLIVDTAGRLHIDDIMMDEIKALHQALLPIETLFVVDSMTGQDAANTAKAFHDALPLTGIILTKTDGDSRGGAALSIRHITGKPIKFMGVGEKIDALEPFYPERMASRLLDMGDMLSFIEEIERKADQKKSEKMAKKLSKGKSFDLEDYRDQLQQISSMGGLATMAAKMPGMGGAMAKVKSGAVLDANEKLMAKSVAIINSMTPKERRFPNLVAGSRKLRIAKGSGTQVQDVNKVLKQFMQMQKMFKKLSSGGNMKKMMRGMGGMMGAGGMPDGMF